MKEEGLRPGGVVAWRMSSNDMFVVTTIRVTRCVAAAGLPSLCLAAWPAWVFALRNVPDRRRWKGSVCGK